MDRRFFLLVDFFVKNKDCSSINNTSASWRGGEYAEIGTGKQKDPIKTDDTRSVGVYTFL